MMALLDTSESLAVCATELGCDVGQLFTPLTRFSRQCEGGICGIDNGCLGTFDEAAFMALLERERPHRKTAKFVCCPDVVVRFKGKEPVGDARRTLEVFDIFRHRLRGWPVALVAQDGLEGIAIPWDDLSAIFIGGSTGWKDGPHAANIVKAAKILGKWVHVGRINTPDRWNHFADLGADSCDGSGLARYSWMRERIRDRKIAPQKAFDFEEVAA